jgi:Uncharacterized protein conserved in bacteria
MIQLAAPARLRYHSRVFAEMARWRSCLVRAIAMILLLTAMPVKTSLASGTASQALANLAEEFWQGNLFANPVEATSLGDRRYDDRLDDITPEGIAREKARLQNLLARAQAVRPEELSEADRITRTALISEVESQLARIE